MPPPSLGRCYGAMDGLKLCTFFYRCKNEGSPSFVCSGQQGLWSLRLVRIVPRRSRHVERHALEAIRARSLSLFEKSKEDNSGSRTSQGQRMVREGGYESAQMYLESAVISRFFPTRHIFPQRQFFVVSRLLTKLPHGLAMSLSCIETEYVHSLCGYKP